MTAGAIDGAGVLSLQSGADTNIKGATLSACTVKAQVGTLGAGNLVMASPQDTSHYKAKETSLGVNVGIGLEGSPSSAGSTYSDMKLLADFQSAREQTAIRAGAGGFDITVNGASTLKGAALASVAAEDFNALIAQTLSLSDLKNFENINSEARSLSLQYSTSGSTGGGSGKLGGSTSGYAEIDRATLGATKAAIGPVVINITRSDLQKCYDLRFFRRNRGALSRINRGLLKK